MTIRRATRADFPAIWTFFEPIARAGETYGFDRDIDRAQAERVWIDVPAATYVAEIDDAVVGSYYVKANHGGPGAHVCNCGYMVDPAARGRGVATALCEHSQDAARALGFQAMQFNLVAVSNAGAVRLWTRLGFATVGRLPRAFDHPAEGYVDALVMYKWLG
ncbi:MAG: N-acetyltransferase [Acidobacteriota bacterium]